MPPCYIKLKTRKFMLFQYINEWKRTHSKYILAFLCSYIKIKQFKVNKVAMIMEIFNIFFLLLWFFHKFGMNTCLLRFHTFLAERYIIYKWMLRKPYMSKHALILFKVKFMHGRNILQHKRKETWSRKTPELSAEMKVLYCMICFLSDWSPSCKVMETEYMTMCNTVILIQLRKYAVIHRGA